VPERRGLIWFAAVADGRLLVPARAEIDTRFGKIVVEAEDSLPFRSMLRPAAFH
jgi:hypothetical protein